MGTIIKEYTTEYEVGDVVIFEKNNSLQVGIIEGYYVDDNVFWFNIRISAKFVYTYTNHGDIGEHDIIGKVSDELKEVCMKIIMTT